MSNNKKLDPGLEYLRRIGFKRLRGGHGLIKKLYELYGRQKGDEIYDRFSEVSGNMPELYKFKNSSMSLADCFSETMDIDIIREFTNYIYNHKNHVGKRILDIGCDTGVLTCSIASLFPDSQITAIDIEPAGVELAKVKAKQLGLTNITFLHASLDQITEQFDTVFSLRVAHENFNQEKMPYIGEPSTKQIASFKDLLQDYSRNIANRCINGNLIAVERLNFALAWYGWNVALSECGLGQIDGTYEEIICQEGGNTETFLASIYSPKGMMMDLSRANELFENKFKQKINYNIPYKGWA